MNVRNLLLLATILIVPVPALAQDAGAPDSGSPDAGIMTEDDSTTGQVYACTVSCVQRVMSGDIRLDQCVSDVPECAGLEAEAGAIRSGICQQARDLVGQCGPITGEEPASGTAAAVEVTPEPRSRPRRFQLICQNGTTEGRGWQAHCVCGAGRVGVDESRYVLPIRQRRERYSRTSASVIRVMYCVPGDPVSIASAREAVSSDLEGRVAALERAATDHEGRIVALEARPMVSADGTTIGVSPDQVRELVNEAMGDIVTHPELQEIVDRLGVVHASHNRTLEMMNAHIRCLEGDRDWQEYRFPDGSVHRLRCREHRGSANAERRSDDTAGSFGFRLSGLLSVGFQRLSFREQDSGVPVYVAGELGVTVSVADRWYLEGAVGFGYAFEDAAVGDGFQGQYRIGALRLFDISNFPIGFAFGGIVTERYDAGFSSGAFVSDHTLAGGYLEFLLNAPPHGAAFYGFVRLNGGAGLRFRHQDEYLNFDGAIQFGIGLARFGDD